MDSANKYKGSDGSPHRSSPILPLDWTKFDKELRFERCPILNLVLMQFGMYSVMFLSFLSRWLFPHKAMKERNREGYAPLYSRLEEFFSHYVYRRGRHCYNSPVCSAPNADITLMERVSDDYNWTFRFTGRQLKCVNLGSYNYLGYRGGRGKVEAAARRYGLALHSSRAELGTTPLHVEFEHELADFLGVEAAMVVGNGFSANTLTLPGLLSPNTLVLSDAKIHASQRLGLRVARSSVRVFQHNDMRHLEELARRARAEGCWDNIVVMMEGVYSMEGSVGSLPAAIALKKQLGLHIYIDEAHSIGLGPRGRGVTDLCGESVRDVDVLMGSFSKSFPGMGGYIAGSAALVNRVRLHGHAHAYAQSMPPPVAAQMLCALRDLCAPAGQARATTLRDNTRYFRERLRAMDVVVYGHPQSPVVPMMVYSLTKMAVCVERLLTAGVAAVGVGFPATPLYLARMRFCLSAAHTREHLDKALAAIEAVVEELGLRYSREPIRSTTNRLTFIDVYGCLCVCMQKARKLLRF
ncbi:serine palmitoyltransferase 2-like [Leguminivora glycinivorella]|uniref:serine palmitoyltransferase 2-like n=1 Tax=Leguminivora glycinivorella TaxID=1035111 RepID=UPI00200D7FAF|nr:serine palmitoyltransferase 2-like [Leguminivora glycinivorella]